MDFILTYDGSLPTKSRPSQKHEIRCALHPQLKELWSHPPLRHDIAETEPGGRLLSTVGGHQFTAIVHPLWAFRAKLNILILKPELPGNIVLPGGDIDNRLKTLFDALTRPRHEQDVPKSWTPEPDEEPLHCLLEDDGLISSVAVKTDRLLAPRDGTHVNVIIDVSIWTTYTFGGFGILAP